PQPGPGCRCAAGADPLGDPGPALGPVMRPASPGSVAVIDVGGTETKTGLVQPDGSLTDTATTPTPAGADVVDGVLNLVQHHVHRLRGEHPDLAGVGLVVPGIVDEDEQVAVLSANLGWQHVPFADLAARRTGLPAALGHDVAAAGLAELELGAAMGADDAAVIPIGTGIAAAVFAGGRAIRGGGFAGELGHTPVVVDGEACTCGSTGCLETIASAAAITR